MNFWNILKLSCPSNVAGVWASNHSDPLGSIASRWHHQLPLLRRSGQGIHQFFRHVPAQKFTELGRETDNTFSSFVTKEKIWKQNDNDNLLKAYPVTSPRTKERWRDSNKVFQGIQKELAILSCLRMVWQWNLEHSRIATNPPGMSNSFSMHPSVRYLCVQPLHRQIQHLCCELEH